MNINRFTLETYREEMNFDNKQRKSVERCPFCGKGNRDGKFVPYRGYTDRGHCHSCGKFSPIGKHICPGCHLVKSFNRYIDTENSNRYLSNEVGKCLYCDYHYPPKQYFEDNKNDSPRPINCTKQIPLKQIPREQPPQPKPTSYISIDTMQGSLKGYDQNNFVKYLFDLFGVEVTNELISSFNIGTSKYWNGSTVFWQIDTIGRIRTGKIMLYDEITGKRIKKPCDCITWVQSALKLFDFDLKQCLFGEHLLKDNTKPVAIVESEKTAIIASIYLPRFIWLAVGGKDGLSFEKCSVLTGRTVVLFPDVKEFDKWSARMKELSQLMPGTRFEISDLLEKNATEEERKQGCDIADYLIKFDVPLFRKAPVNRKPLPEWEPFHLFRFMEDHSYIVDAIDF
ncbi:MAG: DUF6371 domain-containing protein [Prolixibacteraceae bacterium]